MHPLPGPRLAASVAVVGGAERVLPRPVTGGHHHHAAHAAAAALGAAVVEALALSGTLRVKRRGRGQASGQSCHGSKLREVSLDGGED